MPCEMPWQHNSLSNDQNVKKNSCFCENVLVIIEFAILSSELNNTVHYASGLAGPRWLCRGSGCICRGPEISVTAPAWIYSLFEQDKSFQPPISENKKNWKLRKAYLCLKTNFARFVVNISTDWQNYPVIPTTMPILDDDKNYANLTT